MKLLVTGFPGSGTKYVSEQLRLNGIECPHEARVGRDGIVSWFSAYDNHYPPRRPKIRHVDFNKRLHLVRHPVGSCNSFLALRRDETAIKYMMQCLGEKHFHPANAMDYWVRWNRQCERVCNERVRIEDIEEQFPYIMRWFDRFYGYTKHKVNPVKYNSKVNNPWGLYGKLTEDDLTFEAKELMLNYGYAIRT